MELTNFKDFYIDIDGDVKVSNDGTKMATFVTNTKKLNSEYIIANNLSEIKNLLDKINPLFELDIEILKQYSIKRDIDGNIVGIKIYSDNTDNVDNLDMVLTGYDITANNVIRDYYFIGSIENVNQFIKKNNLTYEIKEFDTHKHFLYSVKYDINNKIINFKTYYIINDNVTHYTKNIIPHLKNVLKFDN